MKLGVNIDHIATLRQARAGKCPDLLAAARVCEASGADSIVVHLREDRRHIQDGDVRRLRAAITTRLNLEMSCAPGIVTIACCVRPHQATLVPERRRELTTEGGLDVAGRPGTLKRSVTRLLDSGIDVSAFIDPRKDQIDASARMGIRIVELHTGAYANAAAKRVRQAKVLQEAAVYASRKGLMVAAGHGLDYQNVVRIARMRQIRELNIGFAIICRSITVGLSAAVREMKRLISP